MSDIDIARATNLKEINQIAKAIGVDDEFLEHYGKYKAKINVEALKNQSDKKNGNLVLVTAINPTPLGEGKTTVSIGLADALNKIGKKTIVALREPSLGPVFGLKGGATGGGMAQIAPMEDINLHFTGDIHAITSANNLLSAMIDNHIYFGNELRLKKVTWKRCLDLNDRQLRKINTGLSAEKNTKERMDGFDISVASEIMAILCLAKNLKDLRRKIDNIVVGFNEENKKVTVKDLKAGGALAALLKDAVKPNLVQTLEGNPAIVHGGPFANIAHGCNSVIASKFALEHSEYTVTEAGFGADLGAEKFIDIKSRHLGVFPDAVVCVATIRALKYHGGMAIDDIEKEGVEFVKIGSNNLIKHVQNLKNVFGLNVVVAINKFSNDLDSEIETLKNILTEKNIEMSIVECWEKGSNGAIELAKKIEKTVKMKKECSFAYDLDMDFTKKIECVCKKVYGASDVHYTDTAKEKIEMYEQMGFGKLPVCISKTQYSFSDDPKNLKCDKPFDITVRDVELKAGSEFLVVLTGKVITMPGLPKRPAAEQIDIDKNGNIVRIILENE